MDIATLLNPSSTVLLVIDKQAGYFDPALVTQRNRSLPDDAAVVLARMDDFIEEARTFGVEVVWTQMVEDLEMSPAHIAQIMSGDPDGAQSITKLGDSSFEIYGRVRPLATEKVFTKFYYDAFAHTGLAEYLHAKNIQTVILVGGYANRCVLSSAVGANGNNMVCVVARDLVMNQLKASHELPALYDVVNAIFGVAIPAADIRAVWKNN